VATLILINGQGGAGKSTTAKHLLHMLRPAAYIPTDSLISVEPFEWNEGLLSLGIRNAALLIHSFTEAGYEYIILCGLLNRQELLERFCSEAAAEHSLLYVWLRASQAVRNERRIQRARDDADRPEHFAFLDALIPDLAGPLAVPNGSYIEIDTTHFSPREVAQSIQSAVSRGHLVGQANVLPGHSGHNSRSH
jgi:hypothetical protein